MKSGLLWYDNDPQRDLEDKISLAAQRYREKFGRWPNMCLVHPQAMAGQSEQKVLIACAERPARATIQVVSAPNVLLHHYWLGQGARQAAGVKKRKAS